MKLSLSILALAGIAQAVPSARTGKTTTPEPIVPQGSTRSADITPGAGVASHDVQLTSAEHAVVQDKVDKMTGYHAQGSSDGKTDKNNENEILAMQASADALFDRLEHGQVKEESSHSTPNSIALHSGEKPGWSYQREHWWHVAGTAKNPVWYRDAEYTGTYDGAKTFCAAQNGRLPTYAELCPSAKVNGGMQSGDQWAPFADSVNSVNDWASVGERHTECKLHTAYGYKPAWGTTAGKAAYQKNIMCMLPPPVAQHTHAKETGDEIHPFLCKAQLEAQQLFARAVKRRLGPEVFATIEAEAREGARAWLG